MSAVLLTVPNISFRGLDRAVGLVSAITAETADGDDRGGAFLTQTRGLYPNVERLTMELGSFGGSPVHAMGVVHTTTAEVAKFFLHGIFLSLLLG
jgi:hypothetical protein